MTAICGVALAWMAGCVPAADGGPGPAGGVAGGGGVARPAPVSGLDDRWLAAEAESLVRQAVATGDPARLAEAGERIDALTLARLCCGKPDDLDALADLVHHRRAAKRLAEALRIMRPAPWDGKALAAWLTANPAAARTICRALEDAKNAPLCLERLAELLAADEAAVKASPDLAAAFATAEPPAHERPQPRAAGLVESFLWYARPSAPLAMDARRLPFELSRHVADTRLGIEERRWAVERFGPGASFNPAKPYFDIKYDEDHLLRARPKRNLSVDYTLPNLQRLGGVCFDQAYYASETCKALGMPAAVVFGRGGSGVPHSWFAHLKKDGRSWDAQVGRYQQNLYLSGMVREPADGRMIPDSVLAAMGAALALPADRRERSLAAVALARLVNAATAEGKTGDVSVLTAAAERAGIPAPGRAWIAAKRKPDASLVEDLLAEALKLNPVENSAWDLIAELRKADALTVARTGRFLDVAIRETARGYPDYSFLLVMRLVPTLPDGESREKSFRAAMAVYPNRPDLAGRLLIAVGDELRAAGSPDKAAAAYEEAAGRNVALCEIVVKAAARAEEIYEETKRPDAAVKLYQRLFSAARRDPMAGIFRNQTSHYQLGRRLAELLEKSGQGQQARAVLTQIE
jgi:tetratricopeptide (TPR) repeat protein